MDAQFHGDGDGFEIRIKVRWATLNAFCKMVVATTISLLLLWPALATHLHNAF